METGNRPGMKVQLEDLGAVLAITFPSVPSNGPLLF